jgi:phosphohistidine phosphatase
VCRFKYVLLRVSTADARRSKLVVRGYNRCEYHNDVLQVTKKDLRGSGLHVGVLGGGRILHDPASTPCVTVYGYSSAFGAALHEVSAVIIRRAFPMYNDDDVAVSYEGY